MKNIDKIAESIIKSSNDIGIKWLKDLEITDKNGKKHHVKKNEHATLRKAGWNYWSILFGVSSMFIPIDIDNFLPSGTSEKEAYESY